MAEKFERNFDEYLQEQDAQEEQQPQEQFDLPYSDGDDERTNLMNLLNFLEEELTRARPVPMTNKRMLDAAMCIDIINDIRSNLPLAIQYSEQILRDRERMLSAAEQTAANRLASADVRANAALDDAHERAERIRSDAQIHADNIVKDAELRARALIDQNTIKLEAQKKAAEIINSAKLEAQERRAQAADYCDQLLRDAEETLSVAYDEVRRSRQLLGQARLEERQ